MVHLFLYIKAWLWAFKSGNVLTGLLNPDKESIIYGDEVSDRGQKNSSELTR